MQKAFSPRRILISLSEEFCIQFEGELMAKSSTKAKQGTKKIAAKAKSPVRVQAKKKSPGKTVFVPKTSKKLTESASKSLKTSTTAVKATRKVFQASHQVLSAVESVVESVVEKVETAVEGVLKKANLTENLETKESMAIQEQNQSSADTFKIPVRKGGYRPGAVEATKTLAELSDQPIEFKVGDNAVYPGHGVGRVNAIESKEIGGQKLTFYSIQIIETGMKIMVPQANVRNVGLRPIITKIEADQVIGILKETNVKIDNQTWNRRYREYMEKIKTGGVKEIAEVLRDLFLLKVDKELSFGERKMLDTARSLLLKELILATGREELMKEEDVKSILGL